MKMLAIPLALLTGLSFSALAAEPETEAVEFFHVGLHHYFITATASEAKLLDDGAAGPGWVRTGRSFQAWLDPANAPSNAAPVCRFYSAGANSHFYTADAAECETLKRLETEERDRARSSGAAILGWQYEGVAFRIESPSAGACPAGTTAVSRVYNDGFATGEGANHRFVDDAELRSLMVDRSWIVEGVAFCARAKASGTQANLPATHTNFDAVASSWSGSAHWEKHATRTEIAAPLALQVSANGAVSGSGNGCTFSGQLQAGDGFRSLFTGTLAASGCSDAAFNGTYRRFDIERYGNGTLMLEAKTGDGANEASIEATLASATSTTNPGAPASAPIPAGNWLGTVGWTIVRRDASATTTVVSANRPLSLTLSSSGAVSGSGFGCTISGSLASLSANGCTEPGFNGTFTNVQVKRDDGRLEVEIERETQAGGVTTKATIGGPLDNASTTPVTDDNTPAAPAGIAGSFSGSFTADVEIRDRTRNTTTTTSASSSSQFSVTSNGALSGSGFGCSFSGSLAAAAAGTFSGTITANGCTNAAMNGSYAASAHLDNGALSLEMQSEVEAGNLRTKVSIRGTAQRT